MTRNGAAPLVERPTFLLFTPQLTRREPYVMPNSASAKKNLRQNDVRRLRNRAAKSTLRTHVKKVRKAIEAKDIEQSEALFRVAAKRLDQAASKNLIHDNVAARTKSRLSKAIKGLKG